MLKFTRWIAAALLAVPLAAAAQAYPDKPVRIIVPFTPGSGGDTVARVVADELRKTMGGTFVIDNKPGAAGQIGTEMAAKAPPDCCRPRRRRTPLDPGLPRS
jgi:tripartite-type tricarboxylate transporter receptor subunit TctC